MTSLNIKIDVEQPISKQGILNFSCSLFFHNKKIISLTIATKWQITEIAIFSGYGGNYINNNKKLHVKFGCSRAVLKFGGWQLKNSKITGKKWKIGQKSVKEWSNGLDLTIHGSFLLLQDSPKKFIGL